VSEAVGLEIAGLTLTLFSARDLEILRGGHGVSHFRPDMLRLESAELAEPTLETNSHFGFGIKTV
jgi:hypothetical protein